jgi:hypothetical protein
MAVRTVMSAAEEGVLAFAIVVVPHGNVSSVGKSS